MQRIFGIHSGHGAFHKRWAYYLRQNGHSVREINFLHMNLLSEVRDCDGILWHLQMAPSFLQAAIPILNSIEFGLGIATLPNWKTRWHFENKISQAYLFDALNVRTPGNHVFWSKDLAMNWIQTISFPVVHKYSTGAGSLFVKLVTNKRQAQKIIQQAFSPRGMWQQKGYYPVVGRDRHTRLRNYVINRILQVKDSLILGVTGLPGRLPRDVWLPQKDCVLFQEFLPGNEYDTRVTIIGDRAFAFQRTNRDDDFRASGSGRIDHAPDKIDPAAIEIAFGISKRTGFQSMAYDFLYNHNGDLCVCEMSFGFQNKAVFDCPGHWDSFLNFHPGHLWPEQAHVIDLLEGIADGRT